MNLENKYQKLFQPIKINQLEVKIEFLCRQCQQTLQQKMGMLLMK